MNRFVLLSWQLPDSFCRAHPGRNRAEKASTGCMCSIAVRGTRTTSPGGRSGVNVGKPIDISVSCYLVHHADGYFLWDTGISDAVASMPDGWYPGNNPATDIHWTRAKTLESQLAAIGVKPSDIKFVGISHTHPDHIGNAELFPARAVPHSEG